MTQTMATDARRAISPEGGPRRAADDRRPDAEHVPWPWRVYGWLRSSILTAAAALGAVCILVFGASLALGLTPLVVISGSMEPTIPVGSVVLTRIVKATEIVPGEVVTTDRSRERGLVTHRVVSVTPMTAGTVQLVLRGDANSVDDPEPYLVSEVGRYVAHVPALGGFAMQLRTPSGIAFAVSGLLFLAMFFVLDPVKLRTR